MVLTEKIKNDLCYYIETFADVIVSTKTKSCTGIISSFINDNNNSKIIIKETNGNKAELLISEINIISQNLKAGV